MAELTDDEKDAIGDYFVGGAPNPPQLTDEQKKDAREAWDSVTPRYPVTEQLERIYAVYAAALNATVPREQAAYEKGVNNAADFASGYLTREGHAVATECAYQIRENVTWAQELKDRAAIRGDERIKP